MAQTARAAFLLNIHQSQYETMRPTKQRALCDELRDIIETVNTRNKNQIGPLVGLQPAQLTDQNIDSALDSLNWQMTIWLRYAKPTRIYEATRYVEAVLAQNARNDPSFRDPVALLYYGASLSRTPDAYDRALASLNDGLEAGNMADMSFSMLYGHATRSRLFRRMGRVPDAEADEEFCRKWIRSHPFAMPPSNFIQAVSEDGEEENPILDHPSMADYGQNQIEVPVPPEMGSMFRNFVIHRH